ncbi:MAG: elongation factor Ts [Kiritimatiellia bacterium]|jgi:elongation factor Ts
MSITAAQVKELRAMTNGPMMECKKALVQADGDIDKAIAILRETGIVKAARKADREAKEGLIVADIKDDAQSGALVMVNCETDFVSKNETFQAFVAEMGKRGHEFADGEMTAAMAEALAIKIQEIGENLIIGVNVRYQVEGTGMIGSYIHMGGKVGVLVELGCGKAETTTSEATRLLSRDICMHIAALSPKSLDREGVPAEDVAAEKALYAKQVEGKPPEIIDKILAGKLDKFYSQSVLREQGFVKDPEKSVTDLVNEVAKAQGDEITIRRYVRYQVGS